jgi:hypothetical protein
LGGHPASYNNAIPLHKAVKGDFAERPKNSCCNIISIANAGASGRLGLLQVGDRKLTTDHIKNNFKGRMDEISDLTVI